MIWVKPEDCICVAWLERRTLRPKMTIGIIASGRANMVMSVSLGCCQSNSAIMLINVIGSLTMTLVALLKTPCSAPVSFITWEMSWPLEFSV